MLYLLGETQQKLLKLLMGSSQGKTVDRIAVDLGISRNAVNQHISSLEKNKFVEVKSVLETGGRPSRTYALTSAGQDLFPKQYPWFSGLMLKAIKADRGSQGLVKFLKAMAVTLAKEVKQNMKGKNFEENISDVVSVMQSLSYEATSSKEINENVSAIEATNCVYHHLAVEHPEVCEFDLELLRQLLDSKVTHQQCILRSNGKCRFTFDGKST